MITCFDCINSDKTRGFGGSYHEPPSPPEAECRLPESEVSEEMASDAYEDASNCPYFSPIMAGNCAICQAEINKPLHESNIVFYEYYSGEPVHCCSEECAEIGTKKEEKVRIDDEQMNKEAEEYMRNRF